MQLLKYVLSPTIALLQINFEEHSGVQLIYPRKSIESVIIPFACHLELNALFFLNCN